MPRNLADFASLIGSFAIVMSGAAVRFVGTLAKIIFIALSAFYLQSPFVGPLDYFVE